MRRRSVAPLIVIACAVVLVAVGAILVAASPSNVASFGWYAYQPLAGAVFLPGGLMVTNPWAAAGLSLGAVGLIGLSGGIGFLLGQRRRRAADGA
ncbi:MAG: hypothetical protein J0J05_05020 [Microbacterium sp.]|uniref:hypothetical protein n=1 Tax=Microbacterium sp. TaxID=51671 RepID=UPI001ACD422B|nr:hypothetical protein [Microbacterium sp.]MBN9153327.1 hypothetical protein [Microbacterium sp.]